MSRTPILHVTDHAILRYAERVLGLDKQAIIEHILKHACDPWKQLGDCKVNLPGTDQRAVVVNSSVVTVEPQSKMLTKNREIDNWNRP